jgi:uncharacterized membrane protein YgdD (TMEM256/DUF423 family)
MRINNLHFLRELRIAVRIWVDVLIKQKRAKINTLWSLTKLSAGLLIFTGKNYAIQFTQPQFFKTS